MKSDMPSELYINVLGVQFHSYFAVKGDNFRVGMKSDMPSLKECLVFILTLHKRWSPKRRSDDCRRLFRSSLSNCLDEEKRWRLWTRIYQKSPVYSDWLDMSVMTNKGV